MQFTPGAVYDRKTEINGPFGGSRQSGISASATHPAIFIFTGEGQRGDMTPTRGNRALAEYAENGKAIYLFESLGKGNGNRYKGEFSCADILERIQPDVDGHDRTAFVFAWYQ
ncbi:MAG: hypothetical protein RR517_21095 [Pseudomonas sp.]